MKEGNDEYLVPNDIFVTDGEKAWYGRCNPKRDSIIKGTTPRDFWLAAACAFRDEKPTHCTFATTSLQWSFDPAASKLKVEWKIEYDDPLVLNNSMESHLSLVKDSSKKVNPTCPCIFSPIDTERQGLIQSSASALLQQRIDHENRIIARAEELCAVKMQRQALERSVKDIADRCRPATARTHLLATLRDDTFESILPFWVQVSPPQLPDMPALMATCQRAR